MDCVVTRDGIEVKLHPRAMDVLGFLAQHAGQVVTHEQLLATFWRGTASSPNAVHKCVAELRRAFASAGSSTHHDCIDTIPKRGYRLNLAVQPATTTTESAPQSMETAFNRTTTERVAPTASIDRTTSVPRTLTGRSIAAGLLLLGAAFVAVALYVDREVSAPQVAQATQVLPGLAVLRFEIEGQDRMLEAIAEGIPRAVAESLKRGGAVAVVDPDLSFKQSSSGTQKADISSALGVGYLLNGSIRQVGNAIRVTAVLNSEANSEGVKIYQQDLGVAEMSTGQQRSIDDIVESLTVLLDADQVAEMQEMGTRNVKAYLAARESQKVREKLGPESLERAAAGFREAIALDPGFLEAYVVLALTLKELGTFETDYKKRQKLLAEVQELGESLIRIDPNFRDIAAVRMSAAFLAQSWADLETEVRVDIRESGGDSNNFNLVRYFDLLKTGRLFAEADQYLERFEAANPDEPYSTIRRREFIQLTEGPKAALVLMKRNLEQFPDDLAGLYGLIQALSAVGDFAQAEYHLAHLKSVDPSNQWSYGAWIDLAVKRGDLTVGSQDLEDALNSPFLSHFTKGAILLSIGELESGLTAWRQMDPGQYELTFRYTTNYEVYFPESVRADPRYQQFLDEFGIGTQWTEYLRSKVLELAPITGIYPSPATPQKVFNASRDMTAAALATNAPSLQ